MFSYHDVTLGFPAGNRGAGVQDGLAASWVVWSTGELRVDSACYSLCFVHAGKTNIAPQPLGCLIGASLVQEAGGLPSIIANTNDMLHNILRLSFKNVQDVEHFMAVARTVESKHSSKRARFSSFGPQSDCMDTSMEQLADVIRERCAGTVPIIYGGAELYGQEPGSVAGTEVLLGRGAIALVDPPEIAGAEWVGTYDLIFYDENTCEPTLRVPVGPRMKLSPQIEEAHPGRRSAVSRASMARRQSIDSPNGVCFDFTYEGVGVSALTFDRDVDAQAFVRDLSVRLRLTRTSMKASHGIESVGNLRGELYAMRRDSLAANAWRWTIGLIAAICVVMLLHGCHLCFIEDYAVLDVPAQVLCTTAGVAEVLVRAARNLGVSACQAMEGGHTVSTKAVDSCAAMLFAPDALACIQTLSTRAALP